MNTMNSEKSGHPYQLTCLAQSKNTPLFLKEKSSFAKAMEENGDGKKINQIITSSRPQGRASRLTQSSTSHLHIFTQSAFTLIELLVITSQLCRDIFKRSVSRFQNTPLFLKEKGSARGKENFFSREKTERRHRSIFSCPP